MVKVKVCANKSIEDAQKCIDAGVDIIGILVGQKHASCDFVDESTAKKICEFVDGRCDVAIVTHLTEAKEIIELTKFIRNNIIQLHSDIAEGEVSKIQKALPNVKLIRLIHLSQEGQVYTDIKKIKYSDFYILDSFNIKTNQVGGTGLPYDWGKANKIIEKLNKPVFLAGGLSPDNVARAIEAAKPYGVDVNTGCRSDTGERDADKIKLFVKNVKKK